MVYHQPDNLFGPQLSEVVLTVWLLGWKNRLGFVCPVV